MLNVTLYAVVLFIALLPIQSHAKTKQPNFVWLLSEDSGREHFNLYDKQGAITPNIEQLAKHGLVFETALSNAPVCSVARSTLATGAYAPRIGVQYHRAWQYANLPENLIPISKMLMDAGYYVSNNYKTDYNFNGTNTFWHENGHDASWMNRDSQQPFFHMQTWETTHSSRLHYPIKDIDEKKTFHDPNNITVAPYYPNTKTFRYTYARYLDKIKEMDQQLGKVTKQLAEQGLLEDTFIFFFGDHGGPLPGSKGYLFNRGLQVPLVVRIPKNFEHLLHQEMHNKQGTRISGVVNFVDFAPTLAKLAGLPSSSQHDGNAFLGAHVSLAQLNKRDKSYAYADRFDERSSLLRSIHQNNFQYIRRYEPFTPDSLFNAYRARQPAYQEWAALYAAGQLSPTQASYFKRQPAEALYDLINDPHQLHNLANEPKHQTQLLAMRQLLQDKVTTLPDVGFFPESFVLQQSKMNIATFGQAYKKQIAKLQQIADLQLQPYSTVENRLKSVLKTGSIWEQYWALIVASYFAEQAQALIPNVQTLLSKENPPLIKARAIQFLAIASPYQPETDLKNVISKSSDLEMVEVLNIAAQLKDARNFILNITMPSGWKKPTREDANFFHKNSKYNMVKDRILFLSGHYD